MLLNSGLEQQLPGSFSPARLSTHAYLRSGPPERPGSGCSRGGVSGGSPEPREVEPHTAPAAVCLWEWGRDSAPPSFPGPRLQQLPTLCP